MGNVFQRAWNDVHRAEWSEGVTDVMRTAGIRSSCLPADFKASVPEVFPSDG